MAPPTGCRCRHLRSFPDFSQTFDDAAPAALRGCAPPFLTALPEPGMVQIWTGLMASTAPGWSMLVRPPANLASPGGYSLYEGIVETDCWFGPLFTNLRLTRTHKPVHLRADFPLLQVQPLPREAYAEQTLNATDGRSRHGRHDRAAIGPPTRRPSWRRTSIPTGHSAPTPVAAGSAAKAHARSAAPRPRVAVLYAIRRAGLGRSAISRVTERREAGQLKSRAREQADWVNCRL